MLFELYTLKNTATCNIYSFISFSCGFHLSATLVKLELGIVVGLIFWSSPDRKFSWFTADFLFGIYIVSWRFLYSSSSWSVSLLQLSQIVKLPRSGSFVMTLVFYPTGTSRMVENNRQNTANFHSSTTELFSSYFIFSKCFGQLRSLDDL